MLLQLDITSVDFSSIESPIDVYDGKMIFLSVPTMLPTNIDFIVWGVSIDKNYKWGDLIKAENILNTLNKNFEEDMDVASINGFGKFSFEDIIAFDIKITPIINNEFIYKNEEVFKISKSWNLDKVGNSFKYSFDSYIYFPFGHCKIDIYSKKRALFQFNLDNVMKYKDFINDSSKQNGYLNLKNLGISNNIWQE
ncbi:hypothetical protein AAEO56_11695 [Flavobacterium sp. DGU11]|uniref:Uncharacterized protein n=1 Tax=Flavobacterium arundinis TaxID=3139143 RepID=A0ABU9HYS8_9FLAO